METEITFDQVLDAAAFAARAHQAQLRKDKKTPYVSHVFRVCLVLRHVFDMDDPRMLCTAILHDVVEDTTTDFDDLAEHYSPEVARWVAALTKDKRMAEAAREAEYIQRLQEAPWQVKACKLADVYDNVSDISGLPAERQQHSLDRAKHYLEALSKSPPPELALPLELTWNLYRKATSS